MKKRVISAVLATVMCLSMGATALAADSSTNNNETETVTEVKASSGVKVDAMEAEQKKAWNAAFGDNAEPKIDAIADLVRAQAGNAVKDRKIVNSGSADVQAPDDYIPGTERTVRFAAGVVASDNIIVYHLTSSGKWERLSATAGDGYITAKFTSFSPVVYVVTVPDSGSGSGSGSSNTTTQGQGGSSSSNNNPAKSPNTGVESNAMLVVMFVMALGGAAWYGKKCFGNAR